MSATGNGTYTLSEGPFLSCEISLSLIHGPSVTGHNNPFSIPPTSIQVSQILQPFRTLQQRHIAANLGTISTVWLRTCYTPGTDEQHAELLGPNELESAHLLSDPALYDFGPNWSRVLDIFPELLGLPDHNEQQAHHAYIQSAVAKFHVANAALAAADPSTISNDPLTFIERTREYYPAEEVRAHILGAMQSSIHKACVVNYILVEDQTALETGKVRLLFLDARGRVVRKTRVEREAAEEMGGFWVQSAWDDLDEWIEAEWGESYRKGGAEEGLLLFAGSEPNTYRMN